MSGSNAGDSGAGATKVQLIKWGIIALCIALGAPLAIMLVKGLVGLVLAALIGLAAINFAPVIAMKFANQGLRMVMSEAGKNPIETLYNELAERQQAAEKFKDSITGFRTEVKNFASRTEEFKKQYPDDVARFESQLATMNKLLTYRESRYKQVQDELKNFSNAIDRAKALWDMSQSAQRMNRLAGMQTSDTFERIKTDAAIDSVTSSVNKAFSEMETSLMENPEVQQAQAAVGAAPSGVALPTPSVAKR